MIQKILFSLGFFVGCWLPFAQAQEYQKAKEVLRANITKEAYLYQGPTVTSRKIIKLPARTNVLIYGKLGNFLEVGFLNMKGWVSAEVISVQGPVAPPPSALPTIREQPSPAPAQEKRPKPKRVRSPRIQTDRPLRINPYVVFGMSGKSFYGQMRMGAMATYDVSETLSVGGLLETVFIKGTYISIGPTVRHEWVTKSNIFNPSLDASFLFYKFDHNADKDQGFGFQWGLGNDALVYRTDSFHAYFTLRGGADMMFFMFDQVRVPFSISAGAALRF